MLNAHLNCLHCPACIFNTVHQKKNTDPPKARCARLPEKGEFDPRSVTFGSCSEWEEGEFGYQLRKMRVMILGIDGYLGWTLALWLGSLGCEVSGIDNYNRRNYLKERGGHTVVPIARMTERLRLAREILGININFREMDILDVPRLKEFIDEVKPEAIVHYAECPSAPYSMIDVEHAISVQHNNVIGTLGLLFCMRDIVPNSSLVKLGTMGEYGTPLSGRPIFEGKFPDDARLSWQGEDWSLGGELIPRDAPSFYHLSKVQDTYNIFAACKFWNLRSVDVMQGVIYGVHTEQVASDPRLRTRLDIDEWFGTVINRYVAQAVVGIPLTVYGSGGQKRGFIALRDAMECMTRLIFSPPKAGEYEVVNQIAGVYSAGELAQLVARIGKDDFGLDVSIQPIENPRIEASQHPYNVVAEKLPGKYGFKSEVSVDEEIRRMFEILLEPGVKNRIEEKKHLIIPRTRWSGDKKHCEPLP